MNTPTKNQIDHYLRLEKAWNERFKKFRRDKLTVREAKELTRMWFGVFNYSQYLDNNDCKVVRNFKKSNLFELRGSQSE